MKLLQINAVYGFGSTGVIAKDIADTLVRDGGEAFCAYQEAEGEVAGGRRVGSFLDWKWHAVYTRLFGKQAYASRGATRRLLKWIDGIKPDIVHLHNLHSNYINLNMLADYLAERDIPTVITLHDCWYFTGKCSHFVSARCDRWQTECGSCPQLKCEVPSLFFDKTAFVLRDKCEHLLKIKNLTLVGCSEWIAGEARKSRLGSADIDVVYNGVDTSVFTPHESNVRDRLGIGDSFVIMGMADKWYDDRNRDLVVRLLGKNELDAHFVIVGCKPHQKEFFEGFRGVSALGYVSDRHELSDIYSSADVFLNLTHADTLPTVNMESICCGTPVVTFDACGSPELVDLDSGIVAEEDNADGIIEALGRIKAGACSFSAYEKHTKFDKNECYKKYLNIYRRIGKR